MEAADPRSLAELISALTSDLADLVRKESELVRAEVSEKISQAAGAGALLGIGAALLLGAFLVLLQALVLALAKVMDPLWASILVGLAAAAAGYALIRSAANKVKPAAMAPDRSVRQLSKDADMVKDQVT